jgi:hypothetical protein
VQQSLLLGSSYLAEWRILIKKINKSNPLRELWQQCCVHVMAKEVELQIDTPTRWSSTVSMLAKAITVQEVIERLIL